MDVTLRRPPLACLVCWVLHTIGPGVNCVVPLLDQVQQYITEPTVDQRQIQGHLRDSMNQPDEFKTCTSDLDIDPKIQYMARHQIWARSLHLQWLHGLKINRQEVQLLQPDVKEAPQVDRGRPG